MTRHLQFFEVSIDFVYFAKVRVYVSENYLVFKRPRFYDISNSMNETSRKQSLEPSGASSVAKSATMTSTSVWCKLKPNS